MRMSHVEVPASSNNTSGEDGGAVAASVSAEATVETRITETEMESYLLDNEVYVETGDGVQILLSRRHLAMHSLFFRTIFAGEYAESRKPVIRLPSLTSRELRQCVSLLPAAYRGVHPEMTLQEAIDLLPVASFLLMDHLLRLLSSVILRLVGPHSLVTVFRKAVQRYPPLASQLWSLLMQGFSAMVLTKDHLQLSEDEMIRAMTDETLNIRAADEVLAVSTYCQTYSDDSSRLRSLSTQLMNRVGDGHRHPVIMNRVPHEVVVAMGGWSIHGPTDTIEAFNPRNDQWVDGMPHFACSNPIAYHSLNICKDKVYVCGGMNGREQFRKASMMDLSTGEWSTLPPMKERRCYVSGASLIDSHGAGRIMVVGGFNGHARLASCELFDVEALEWESIPRMTKHRSDGAVVRVGDRVAAIGGFEGRVIHQDMEIFDLGSERWHGMARPMRSARTGTAAVALDENIVMVSGGYSGGERRLKTVELMDLREGIWHAMPYMNVTRSNYALELLGDKVMAVGGFEGSRTTAAAERFDIVAQRWEVTTSMTVPRSAVKMVRVTGQDVVRKLVRFTPSGEPTW